LILLREAVKGDLTLILSWRNNPDVYQGFYCQKSPITWDEHCNWWASRYNWKEFIVVLYEDYIMRPIGVVTLGQLDHWSPEIGYYIGETSLWGKGYGREAVKEGMAWLKKHGYQYTHTTILDKNKRSIRLIKSLGWEYLGIAREGESWYQVKLI